MTMPSLECQSYMPNNQRMVVLDRLKKRISSYDGHAQRCAERYKSAQQTIRTNEKRETMILWQRMQELKNKKGTKCKIDSSRPKLAVLELGEGDTVFQGLGMSRMGASLKRKMDSEASDGFTDPHIGHQKQQLQQDNKKQKTDQRQGRSRRKQDHFSPSVSVQIVQNFGTEVPTDQIETTVNVLSNQNMPDSQPVSANIGLNSGTIKQEMSDRYREKQQITEQQNLNPCSLSIGNPESNDFTGILGEDLMNASDDIDISILHDFIEQMPDVIDELNRELMAPEEQHPTTDSQQMMPHLHRMTSQSEEMLSQGQRTTSQQVHQMASPHHLNLQTHAISQSQHIMTSQGQRNEHVPQSHQKHQTTPLFSRSSRQMTSSLHHHYMPSPAGQHVTSSMMQQLQNPRMVCKREKVDMLHGFRGNTVENNPEHRGLFHQNNYGVAQQNMPDSIMTQQSVRAGGRDLSADISSQQNVSRNTTQQNNFFTVNQRQVPTNNDNMTSSHSQLSYYDSHSHQLKQLAENTRYGINGSNSMNADPGSRPSQPFPPYYYGNGPSMTQQHMHMSVHHGVSHVDAGMHSQSGQYVQSQRAGMNVMMQQEVTMMKEYQIQQSQHHGQYNRIPELHATGRMTSADSSAFSRNGALHSSWNTREPWPTSTSHSPLLCPRHQISPMLQSNAALGPPNYLPELDQELKILDEILSKGNE